MQGVGRQDVRFDSVAIVEGRDPSFPARELDPAIVNNGSARSRDYVATHEALLATQAKLIEISRGYAQVATGANRDESRRLGVVAEIQRSQGAKRAQALVALPTFAAMNQGAEAAIGGRVGVLGSSMKPLYRTIPQDPGGLVTLMERLRAHLAEIEANPRDPHGNFHVLPGQWKLANVMLAHEQNLPVGTYGGSKGYLPGSKGWLQE